MKIQANALFLSNFLTLKIMVRFFIFITAFSFSIQSYAQQNIIDLNGTWDFDQTETAFPPKKFTRKIPVPGLIHLAEPRIVDYEKFFKRPERVALETSHNLQNMDYTPKYSWYKKSVVIPAERKGNEVVLTIKKAQYVTHVYVNGMDAGISMACYTPIDLNITDYVKYGASNELLIRIGDRIWLPSEAAGGTDKEKEHYLPGIWDDVHLSFSDKLKIHRMMVLPSLKDGKITVKALIRNFNPAQLEYGDPMEDEGIFEVVIAEKKSGKEIARKSMTVNAIRDRLTQVQMDIEIPNVNPWSPDDPFLYTATASISYNEKTSDKLSDQFGMRDFERKGKYFYLNGEKTFLRGTNITLQRFFEDPDCGNLAWDRYWVKKLIIDDAKNVNWNAMRICVGIVPDFWYDLADEYGMMFQNEWLYWQNHGWDDQIRKEYTDWIWSDGSHPSIVIWDAINENWDAYIGNELIPELMKLDPTRIWDAGYMTGDQMAQDEMDEPHPYEGPRPWMNMEQFEKDPYPLGDLNYKNRIVQSSVESSAAQLVNEYGWIWLWRDGTPSKLTVDVYKYYLGENSTAEQNREFQAYWLQLETEWLRSERAHAGVLAFTHLTNNYGYTGDWYIDNIKDLKPGPTLDWFKHAFAPAAVFINLTDERYTKHIPPHQPGSTLLFTLNAINDLTEEVNGKMVLNLLDAQGKVVVNFDQTVSLLPYEDKSLPVSITLPIESGGYVLTTEFNSDQNPVNKQISRRFIKVGEKGPFRYYGLKP